MYIVGGENMATLDIFNLFRRKVTQTILSLPPQKKKKGKKENPSIPFVFSNFKALERSGRFLTTILTCKGESTSN